MRALDEMVIVAERDVALATLKENRGEHKKIVEEARKGYIKAAQDALVERLDQCKNGKITNLHFSLELPQDHTKVYDTAIKMLELHQATTIELNATQVRNLLMDEWDWSQRFYMANAAYSVGAAGKYDPED